MLHNEGVFSDVVKQGSRGMLSVNGTTLNNFKCYISRELEPET